MLTPSSPQSDEGDTPSSTAAMFRIFACAVFGLLMTLAGLPAQASNCEGTSVGFTPLDDLGTGSYLGQYQGGLYPGGSNVPPPAHLAEGISRANSIEPLDTNGAPDSSGAVVLLSVGMSNTTQEFCSSDTTGNSTCAPASVVGHALARPDLNGSVVLADGARSGQDALKWDSPNDPNYDRIRDDVLPLQGLTEAQVQVAWVKVANILPSAGLPDPAADAFALEGSIGDIARALAVRYPNLKLVFLASRIYAGYASSVLNPEPYAYESAFSAKWAIEAQIDQVAGQGIDPIAGDLDYQTGAPWLGWGAYLWADGLTPRSDGLIWLCSDLSFDETHPAPGARDKVGMLLVDFLMSDPTSAPWFSDAYVDPAAHVPGLALVGQLALGLILLGVGIATPQVKRALRRSRR